jgi:hypothetical protein
MIPRFLFVRLAALTLMLGCAGQAWAQADIVSPAAFHGLAEIRLAGGDTETSWLKGGFGKTGQAHEGLRFTQAALEWRPSFNFALSGVVTALYQPDVDPRFDIGEAYLKLKAPPMAQTRLSARAGIFYPPVSLEHDGVAWTTPDMLSGSMINSWIGEEVKVTGLEATAQRAFGAHEFEATLAVFGWNDTSGTLLTYRGWASHEVRAGVHTEFELPPLSKFAAMFQPPETYPFRELDRRAGYYGRIEWRPPAPVSFNALYYDNAGDRTTVNSEEQWSWKTRFLNLGMRWDLSDTTRVLAQAMKGRTEMGYVIPGGRWFDVDFASAYVLASHRLGEDTVTGRAEWFETRDRTFQVIDDNTEHGWAVTGAWRHHLAPHADLILEAQHIASKRPARVLAGDAPQQDETLLQSALRLSF